MCARCRNELLGGGGGISVFLIFLFHFVRLISSVQFQNPTRLIPSMESREYFIPCSCITKWEIVMRALDLSSRRQGGRRSMRPTALIKSRFQTPISPLNFHFNRVWKRWAHFPEYSIPCSCKKKRKKNDATKKWLRFIIEPLRRQRQFAANESMWRPSQIISVRHCSLTRETQRNEAFSIYDM